MEIEVKMLDRDYTLFYGWVIKRLHVIFRIVPFFIAGIGIMSIYTLLMMLLGDRAFHSRAIFGLGLVFFWFVIHPALRRRAVRKDMAENPERQSLNYIINEEGLIGETASARTVNKWSAYVGAHESSEYFYLMMTKNMGTILPKRCLTDDEIIELRALLVQHLKLETDR